MPRLDPFGATVEDRTSLKHYEILERLGEGGMGVVYRARDTRLGRTVALKMLPTELAENEERAHRFEREARIASSLSHPGIATLYDFDRDDDVAFLTMELVEGPTLRQLLHDGALPEDKLIECAVQVAEALTAAHREGVTHRDLKPENIMVSGSGYYKVLDFGVARMDDVSHPFQAGDTQTPTRTWSTRAGSLIGTVAYMSPEQVTGKPADARSDIFAFGSVLYELATGTPAFRGPNEIATAHEIVYNSPRPIVEQRPELPDGIDLIVTKCLAKKPEDRYKSAEDLAQDLRTLRRDSQSGTRSGQRLLAYAPIAARRRRMLIGGALVVAALAVAGFFGTRLARLLPGTTSERSAPGIVEPVAPARPQGEALPAAHDGRPRVIVAFFENNSGDPDVAWLSRGLPEMLTTDLSQVEELDVIATQRLHDLLAMAGRKDVQTLDRSTSAELARWAGAGIVISGSVFHIGDSYRIDAQAYDTASGSVIVAHKVEGGDLFEMVGELTEGLRDGLVAGAEVAPLESVPPKAPPPTTVTASKRGPRRPAMTTSSERAYRVFVDGKSRYDNLDLEGATQAFEKSLELDPEFSSARLRLAMSRRLAGEQDEALRLLDESMARAEGMPEPERLMTRGLHAFYADGDAEAGSRYFEEMAEKFPRNNEVYIWWARALQDLGGNPMAASKKLKVVLARDPGNLHAVAAMASQLAGVGAIEHAEGLLADAIAHHPEAEEPLTQLIESCSDE